MSQPLFFYMDLRRKILYYTLEGLEKVSNFPITKDSVNLYTLSSVVDCPMPIDRLNKYSMPFNVVSDPIPTEVYDVDLKDCYASRVRELFEEDKPINILWSGGIDSTSLLCMFLELSNSSTPPITIVFNDKSIEEYPLFYEKYVKNFPSIFHSSHNDDYRLIKYWKEGSLVVTGDLGDQIAGSNKTLHMGMTDNFVDKWEAVFDWPIISTKSIPFRFIATPDAKHYGNVNNWTTVRKHYKNNLKILLEKEVLENSLVPIKTSFDLFWNINFRVKWDWCCWRWVERVSGDLLSKSFIESYRPFYKTEDFQRWSLTNHHLKHEGSFITYKAPFKNLIRQFTKDKEYFYDKTKESSATKLFTELSGYYKVNTIYENYEVDIGSYITEGQEEDSYV